MLLAVSEQVPPLRVFGFSAPVSASLHRCTHIEMDTTNLQQDGIGYSVYDHNFQFPDLGLQTQATMALPWRSASLSNWWSSLSR